MENEQLLENLKNTIKKEDAIKRTVEAEKTIVENTKECGSKIAQDIKK